MHTELIRLRLRLWEGYFLGAFEDYIVADVLEANFTSCALDGVTGCIRLDEYQKDALGIGAQPPKDQDDEDGFNNGFG